MDRGDWQATDHGLAKSQTDRYNGPNIDSNLLRSASYLPKDHPTEKSVGAQSTLKLGEGIVVSSEKRGKL